jgi:hypothetical protein
MELWAPENAQLINWRQSWGEEGPVVGHMAVSAGTGVSDAIALITPHGLDLNRKTAVMVK